jgi:hypothetical protein
MLTFGARVIKAIAYLIPPFAVQAAIGSFAKTATHVLNVGKAGSIREIEVTHGPS